MHTTKTLKLDKRKWDLTLDNAGRLAVCRGAPAIAQNVANQCRLFTQDAYLAQDKGIPHFVVELAQPLSGGQVILHSYLRRAATKVAGVKEVLSVDISGFNPETRVMSGAVEITISEGDNEKFTIDF